MLARALLTLLAATAAQASPAPPTAQIIAKGFSPRERAWNALELAIRQNGCPTGYDTCEDYCYPLDGSVCCNDGTFCAEGTRCLTDGCCPIGKICTGGGGTRTIDFTSVPEPTTNGLSISSSRSIPSPSVMSSLSVEPSRSVELSLSSAPARVSSAPPPAYPAPPPASSAPPPASSVGLPLSSDPEDAALDKSSRIGSVVGNGVGVSSSHSVSAPLYTETVIVTAAGSSSLSPANVAVLAAVAAAVALA